MTMTQREISLMKQVCHGNLHGAQETSCETRSLWDTLVQGKPQQYRNMVENTTTVQLWNIS